MSPFLCAIFLLGLSSQATVADITQVFQWDDELDYEWPSEESRTQASEDGTFIPKRIYPDYMAVYGSRLFLSLAGLDGIPVTLVSMPTSSESFTLPKLTPFPSWEMNGKKACKKIQAAAGLQVDSVGRLWVLDSGSDKCKAKLWTIDLVNNDQTKLLHRFSFHKDMHDLVLDETANGTFAYISQWGKLHLFVFSLESNESWKVKTLKTRVVSIALSPKKDQEPRQLYLGRLNSTELYSISVTDLRNRTRTKQKPKLIGKWTTRRSYRMLIDNYGTLYSAFLFNDNILSWNTSQQPFQEQSFLEFAFLDSRSFWPFTFALDQNGTFWMTVFDDANMPRFRLLKEAGGV